MKSLQELYTEALNDKVLNAKMIEAAKEDRLSAFFRAHGCDATAEEIKALFTPQDQELNIEELTAVAGGNLPSERQSAVMVFQDTPLTSGPGAPGSMYAGRTIRQLGTIAAGMMFSVYTDAVEGDYIYTNSNITALPCMKPGCFSYCWICKSDLIFMHDITPD